MIKRGEIYYADLSPVVGSEQGGMRPVLIVQNNLGNKHSPTVIVAAITAKINKAKLPTHIKVTKNMGLERDSFILLEQLRTIDKQRLKNQVTDLSTYANKMAEVDKGLSISLGLAKKYT